VIEANVGLDDLSTRLWWITRDRRRAEIEPVEVHGEQCPSCGVSRIGAFRWCTACGYDYEASLKSAPHEVSWVPSPHANDLFRQGQERRNPIPRPEAAGRRTRFIDSTLAIWRAARSAPWREIAIAAAAGLLIGMMVTIASAR